MTFTCPDGTVVITNEFAETVTTKLGETAFLSIIIRNMLNEDTNHLLNWGKLTSITCEQLDAIFFYVKNGYFNFNPYISNVKNPFWQYTQRAIFDELHEFHGIDDCEMRGPLFDTENQDTENQKLLDEKWGEQFDQNDIWEQEYNDGRKREDWDDYSEEKHENNLYYEGCHYENDF